MDFFKVDRIVTRRALLGATAAGFAGAGLQSSPAAAAASSGPVLSTAVSAVVVQHDADGVSVYANGTVEKLPSGHTDPEWRWEPEDFVVIETWVESGVRVVAPLVVAETVTVDLIDRPGKRRGVRWRRGVATFRTRVAHDAIGENPGASKLLLVVENRWSTEPAVFGAR